ncbi:MAG: phosphodiesterase [Alphaproteobacteria bacterium]
MLIAHLTDPHIRPRGLTAYRVAETNMLTERAVDAVIALETRPDVVIISGDLTDNGLETEYQNLKSIIERLPMPVWLIPGNHDRRDIMKSVFNGWPGMAHHDTFAQWVADLAPVRVIGLDTVVPGSGAGALCGDRLAWLEARLNEGRDTPTIIVMHHPPFACGIKHMDAIGLNEGAPAFEALVRAHPQIVRILCGHHHRPIQALFGGTLAMVAPSVAHQVVLDLSEASRSALNFEPAAFYLHAWVEGTGLVTHTAYVERAPGPYPFVLDAAYPGQSN